VFCPTVSQPSLNQRMINYSHKPYFFTAVILTIISFSTSADVCADVASSPITSITINSRQLSCIPPGRWDGKTVYLPAAFIHRNLGIVVEQLESPDFYQLSAYDNSLRVTVGQGHYQTGEAAFEGPIPQRADGEPLVPLEPLARAFDIDFAVTPAQDGKPAVKLNLPGADVGNIRVGQHPDKTRVVIDLDRPAGYCWSVEGDRITIEVARPAGERGQPGRLRLLRFDNPVVSHIAQSTTSDGFTRLVIAATGWQDVNNFTLPDPSRIVIDLHKPPPKPAPPEQLGPVRPSAGRWQLRNFCTPRGPLDVYVLKVDPGREGLEIRPVLAGQTVHRRRSVLAIARQHGAVAALNGGFFAGQGPPLGLLIIDGEWIKHPILHRTALGITADGELLMDRVSFEARLYFDDHGYLELDGINRGHNESYQLVMYTPRWGEVLSPSVQCTRLVVSGEAVVVAKYTQAQPVEIPPEGYVISGSGRYATLLEKVHEGEGVWAQLQTKPEWKKLAYALGAGPRVVKDGRPHVTAAPEIFGSDVSGAATSRSAVAITPEGLLMLVAVETPPDEPGRGVTLTELAQILVKLGARDAMNLDGGGSTTVVQGDRVINHPRDGRLRAVSNALLVVATNSED